MRNGMDTSDDRRLNNELRQGLRPGSLSRRQRQRHLDRINAQGAWEMDFIRRRSVAELGLIVAVLLLVGAAGAWQAGLFDRDEDPVLVVAEATPTSSALAQEPTVTTPPVAVEQPSSCDATPFSDSKPQIEHDWAGQMPGFDNWYAGEGIMLSPPDLSAINPSLPATPSMWFTGTTPVLWNTTMVPDIEARHLSNPDTTFEQIAPDSGSWLINWVFLQTVLKFSDPGCWELTATTSVGASLSIVVDVLPAYDRPDHVMLFENWQDETPHPAPSSCNTTPWALEDRSGTMLARFWFDGPTISMSNQIGLFWQGEPNETYWITSDDGVDITLSGWIEGEPGVSMEIGITSEHVTTSLLQNRVQRTELIFPEPGCWTIEATADGITEELTVFVYPAS